MDLFFLLAKRLNTSEGLINQNSFNFWYLFFPFPSKVGFETTKYLFLTAKTWGWILLGVVSLLSFRLVKYKKLETVFLSIFINSVWGQNDILPTSFLYLSFISLFSSFSVLSPAIFTLGVLFKPTIAIISPLYLIVYLYLLRKQSLKDNLSKTILAICSVLLIVFVSFKPFIPLETKPLGYISDIINHRISTSSKGLKLASVSAFNIYSLVFNIDQTYATSDKSIIQLADISNILFVVINIFFITKLIRSKKITFNHTLFSIFFISQGSFLFMTNMLDRYFIPAFLASIVIAIIYWKKFGWLMIVQQIIWITNLIYAYYYRVNEPINHIFRDNNFLVIRIFSLASIFVFICLFQRYQKYLSVNKQID